MNHNKKRSFLKGIILCGLLTLMAEQVPAQNIFVNIRTSGTTPSASTIAAPAGFSYSAAAPVSGTTWNNVGRTVTVPGGTTVGTTTNIYIGLPLTNSTGTGVSQTLTVGYYSAATSGSRTEPSTASGENTIQPGGVMAEAWRNYWNGSGNYFVFTISNLTVSMPYGIYFYGGTTTSGQSVNLMLPNGYALANSPTNASTTNTTANSSGAYGALWTVSGGATNLMPQCTTWNTLYGQSDAFGVLSFRFTGSGSYAYFNGFQLVPLSASTVSGLTNQTVVAGNNATLGAIIGGLPMPNLQWLSNNVVVAGATNSTLALNNVQFAQNGAVYSLVASNIVGAVTNSMTLTVIVTPSITGLNNQAAAIGTTVSIPATVSGVPTPTTHWQFGGNNLADGGATGNGSTIAGSATGTLYITNAQAADSGTYSLVASNSAGMVTNSMTLTVSSGNVAPGITGLADQTVVQTSNAVFSASVSGLPLPTLQWLVNGAVIAGATNSSLTVCNVLYSQNGFVYSLVASNSAGLATNSATLYVLVPPTVSAQPTNLVVTNTQSATFAVTASGVPAPAYKWFFNSNFVSGVTTSNYVIASTSPSNMGNYFAVASNSVGSVTSSVVTLTVNSTMSQTALMPTNGATGICYDTPLYITFSSPPLLTTPGTGKIRIYNVTNPTTPVDTLDMSQNVTLETPFAVNVQQRTIASETFYSYPVIITSNTAAIYPHFDLLTSNQTYYVTIDNTVFTDTNGAYFAGITATNIWKFTTKVGGPANPTNMVVAQDNSGDFATVQGAIDSVPANNTTPTLINIRNGTYTEIVEAHSKNNLTLRGQSRHGTVIAYANNGNMNANTHLEIVFKVNANNISLDNLTLDDTSGYGSSPAEALMIESGAGKFICNNVDIDGYQDTMLANQSSSQGYFNNCLVQGSVDFIWGGGNLFFTNCNILWLTSGGEGPNPSPSSTDINSNGFSFVNCSLTTSNSSVTSCLVGRTRSITNGNTALISCLVSSNIGGWFSDALPTSNFRNWYYSCSNLTATASITLSNGIQLAASDPNVTNAGTASIWLYGWIPTLSPNITSQPTNQTVTPGAAATFTVAATGIPNPVYQWLENGTNIIGQTNATLNFGSAQFANNGTYSVIVSNSVGVVVSSNATLSVTGTAPTITTQPTNQTVALGGTAVFTAAASGVPTPTFQWLKNGAALLNATNATLSLTNVRVTDMGVYSLIALNGFGTAASGNAALILTGSVVQLPSINLDNVIVVTNLPYNAVGDGVTTNTSSIQRAINAAAVSGTTNGLRGGTVEIPAGVYLSGPLNMSNNVNLQIDAGATLQMLPYGSFPATSDFISGSSLHDLEISGGGTIDGQGAVWWATNNATSGGITRPKSMCAFSTCTNILIRDVTLQNPPGGHIAFRYICLNVTIDHININTPSPSPNTDGIDCSASNFLIQNSHISDGDDMLAMGDGHAGNFTHDYTVTNCLFGNGHGVSIGSYTSGGLSNLLVINCVWTNGTSGFHLKSDDDRGGLIQNLRYINLAMTNTQIPIFLYSYYTNSGTSSGASVAQAASYPAFPVSSTTPIWRNIYISNLTAAAASGYPAGIIWGKPEMSFSNVVMDHVNITASKYFQLYNAQGVQLIDSQITVPATNTFALYNAGLIITNRAPAANLVKLEGVSTNGIGNALSLYNAQATLTQTNLLAATDGVTLGGGMLIVSNSLNLSSSDVYTFLVGSNASTVAVNGNLLLGGTNDISAGAGFTNGTYTLMTYTGNLSGNLPTLGLVPAGYYYTLNTNTAKQVKLVVVAVIAPTNLTATATNLQINLKWNSANSATSYNLKRGTVSGNYPAIFSGLTATNYADANVTNAVKYYYVVSASGNGSESSNSFEVAAIPLPSSQPTNIVVQANSGQLQLSWPQDHLGWRLLIQTNNLNSGLGTNWFTVPNSTNVIQSNVPIDPSNDSVFLRLIYP